MVDCSDILDDWRFGKGAIIKMNQIADKTKIIERGATLCGNLKNKKIDLISECKGNKCAIETESWKKCIKNDLVHMGNFHTHPGKIEKTLPSGGDLAYLSIHGGLMCIGAPKANVDRIICIKQKLCKKEDELERNTKLEELNILERTIKNFPFVATKKEREEFDKRFKEIFPGNYHIFDPSKCIKK